MAHSRGAGRSWLIFEVGVDRQDDAGWRATAVSLGSLGSGVQVVSGVDLEIGRSGRLRGGDRSIAHAVLERGGGSEGIGTVADTISSQYFELCTCAQAKYVLIVYTSILSSGTSS